MAFEEHESSNELHCGGLVFGIKLKKKTRGDKFNLLCNNDAHIRTLLVQECITQHTLLEFGVFASTGERLLHHQ